MLDAVAMLAVACRPLDITAKYAGPNSEAMPRILILEDNAEIRLVLAEILDEAGYETITASNGAHAVDYHLHDPVDLIITDIFMPDTDGLEVIYQFRRRFPQVKIIAISGGGTRGLAEQLTIAERMGAQRTYMKPFDWVELLEAVRELTG
jgi:CheY-like chemotaxis protein